MWICLPSGFFSIVQASSGPDVLMVRARCREHLSQLLPDKDIITLVNADYRFRLFVARDELAHVVAQQITAIRYSNFKNSVNEPALHDLYGAFWLLHADYQNKLFELASDGAAVKRLDRSG